MYVDHIFIKERDKLLIVNNVISQFPWSAYTVILHINYCYPFLPNLLNGYKTKLLLNIFIVNLTLNADDS